MKLQAGENLEYEMDLAFSIVHDGHLATCIKDRTALFVDKVPAAITPEFGERLVNWLQSADTPAAPPPELVEKIQVNDAYQTAKDFLSNGATPEQRESARKKIKARQEDGTFSFEQATELLELCNQKG